MNNRLNAEVAHLQTKAEMIDFGFKDLTNRGVMSAEAAYETQLKQREEIANFKQAVLNAVADGESRDSAIVRLKREFAEARSETVSAFTPSPRKQKPAENKLNNPAVQTLFQIGESLAAGNNRVDEKLQDERKLDQKIEARRSAYLKDYYKRYDEN